MNELSSIEKNLNILLPQSYKNTLDKFKLFMEIEFKDYKIDLFNNNLFLNCNMKLNSIQIYNFINFFKKDIQRGSII